MPRFRKRPVIVEAVEWVGQELEGCPVVTTDGKLELLIGTLEGIMRAALGDWIITGVHGERYPCKPAIFAKTYEKVED